MNKIDRYKILVNHLKSLGVIESQQDLGLQMGYKNPSAFSQVLNGKANEPKLFMKKMKEIYPPLNIEWLENGNGSMIEGQIVEGDFVSQTSHGDYSPNINGNGNRVDDSSALMKALDEISELRKQNAEQFNRFMGVIENLTK